MIDWFSLTDDKNWATFLSTAIVLITFSTISASRITKYSFLAYSVVFFIELFGNIFHAFTYIDPDSKGFQDWNLLMNPILDILFYNPDVVTKMRFLAMIQGGALPLLALIFFSFWIYLMNIEDSVSDDDTVSDTVILSDDELLGITEPEDNTIEDNIVEPEIVKNDGEKNIEIKEEVEPEKTIEYKEEVEPEVKVEPKETVEHQEKVEPKIHKPTVVVTDSKNARIEEIKAPVAAKKLSNQPETRVIDNRTSDNNSNLLSSKQVRVTDSRIRSKRDKFKK